MYIPSILVNFYLGGDLNGQVDNILKELHFGHWINFLEVWLIYDYLFFRAFDWTCSEYYSDGG